MESVSTDMWLSWTDNQLSLITFPLFQIDFKRSVIHENICWLIGSWSSLTLIVSAVIHCRTADTHAARLHRDVRQMKDAERNRCVSSVSSPSSHSTPNTYCNPARRPGCSIQWEDGPRSRPPVTIWCPPTHSTTATTKSQPSAQQLPLRTK